jgi:hypothetical protein
MYQKILTGYQVQTAATFIILAQAGIQKLFRAKHANIDATLNQGAGFPPTR